MNPVIKFMKRMRAKLNPAIRIMKCVIALVLFSLLFRFGGHPDLSDVLGAMVLFFVGPFHLLIAVAVRKNLWVRYLFVMPLMICLIITFFHCLWTPFTPIPEPPGHPFMGFSFHFPSSPWSKLVDTWGLTALPVIFAAAANVLAFNKVIDKMFLVVTYSMYVLVDVFLYYQYYNVFYHGQPSGTKCFAVLCALLAITVFIFPKANFRTKLEAEQASTVAPPDESEEPV